jgi:hypothetical protein
MITNTNAEIILTIGSISPPSPSPSPHGGEGEGGPYVKEINAFVLDRCNISMSICCTRFQEEGS